jgi:hypothetical protein
MAYIARSYSGQAQATTLAAAISTGDTTFTLQNVDSWYETPNYVNQLGVTGPFVVALDYNTSSEEKILCSGISGTTVTVASGGRGYDGTSPLTHSQGAVAVVVWTALEAEELNNVAQQTLGKITAAGDLLYGSAVNTLAKRSIGTTGQVLTVAGGVPTWAAPSEAANPAGRMYQSTTGTTVAGGTMASYPTGLGTSLTNMVQDFVNGGMTFSGTGASAGTLTIPAGGGGIYMVSASILWATMAGGNVVTNVVKNGTTAVGQWISNPSATGGTFLQAGGVTLVNLAAGDTLILNGKHNNANPQITNPGSSITYLSAALVAR